MVGDRTVELTLPTPVELRERARWSFRGAVPGVRCALLPILADLGVDPGEPHVSPVHSIIESFDRRFDWTAQVPVAVAASSSSGRLQTLAIVNRRTVRRRYRSLQPEKPRGRALLEIGDVRQVPGGRYVVSLAAAASTSVAVRSTTVRAVAPPPAHTVSAAAAADSLSGKSAMT